MVSELGREEGAASEAAMVGDVGYGEFALFEQFAGFVNTQLVDVLNRTGVVGLFEFPLELADREVGDSAEFFHANASSEMFLDVGNHFRHLSEWRGCILFVITIEAANESNEQIERRSDNQLPAVFLLGVLHANTRKDFRSFCHLLWIEVETLPEAVPTFSSWL